MIYLLPVVCLAILALWTWAVCQTLVKEQSFFWLIVVSLAPPVGIPLYLLNFYLLGDEQRGLTAMQRRAAATKRAEYLRQTLADGEIIAHRLELAEIALDRRDYAEALSNVKQALSRDEENLQGHFIAARAFVSSGKPENALAHLDFIFSEDQSYASYRAAILHATTLRDLSRLNDARPVFEALMNRNSIPEVIYQYALFLMQSGRGDEANALLQRMVSEYRNDPGYYGKRDNAWLKLAKSKLRK